MYTVQGNNYVIRKRPNSIINVNNVKRTYFRVFCNSNVTQQYNIKIVQRILVLFRSQIVPI